MTHMRNDDMSTAETGTGLTRRSAPGGPAGSGLALGPAVGAWAAPDDDEDPSALQSPPEGPDSEGVSRIPVEDVGGGRTAAWGDGRLRAGGADLDRRRSPGAVRAGPHRRRVVALVCAAAGRAHRRWGGRGRYRAAVDPQRRCRRGIGRRGRTGGPLADADPPGTDAALRAERSGAGHGDDCGGPGALDHRQADDGLARELGCGRVAAAEPGRRGLRERARRLRAPHGDRELLLLRSGARHHPVDLPVSRAQPGLLRHRLQLPHRPVRPDLGGRLRRCAPGGDRGAHEVLQLPVVRGWPRSGTSTSATFRAEC